MLKEIVEKLKSSHFVEMGAKSSINVMVKRIKRSLKGVKGVEVIDVSPAYWNNAWVITVGMENKGDFNFIKKSLETNIGSEFQYSLSQENSSDDYNAIIEVGDIYGEYE